MDLLVHQSQAVGLSPLFAGTSSLGCSKSSISYLSNSIWIVLDIKL